MENTFERSGVFDKNFIRKAEGTFYSYEFYNGSHTFNNLFDIPGITDEIQGNDPRRSKTAGLEKYSTDGGTRSPWRTIDQSWRSNRNPCIIVVLDRHVKTCKVIKKKCSFIEHVTWKITWEININRNRGGKIFVQSIS